MPFDRDKLAVLVSLIVLGWGSAAGSAHAATDTATDTTTDLAADVRAPGPDASPAEPNPLRPLIELAEWRCHETLDDSVAASASPGEPDPEASRLDTALPASTATPPELAGGAVFTVVPDAGLATAETLRHARSVAATGDAPEIAAVAIELDSVAAREAAPPPAVEVARGALKRHLAQAAAAPAVEREPARTQGEAEREKSASSDPWLDVAAVLTEAWPEATAVAAAAAASPYRGSHRSEARVRPAHTPMPSPTPASPVVVAGHGDRVLMTLAAVRAPDAPEPAVVASNGEKVLRALEAVRDHRATRETERPVPTQAELAALRLPSLPAPRPVPRVTHTTEVAPSASASDSVPRGAIECWAAARDRQAAAQSCAGERTVRAPAALLGERHAALDDRSLDQVRGGFTLGNGLRVSFGIERAVSVNGNLVASSSLSMSELGKLSGSAARPGAIEAAGLMLVQNGARNVIATGTAAGAVGTVIQNTLNDQNIRNVTVINATVNSVQIARALSLHEGLRNVAIDALRR